jgi:hypothetical protein
VNQWLPMLFALSAMVLTGCNVDFSTSGSGGKSTGSVIAEGTVYSVTYQQADGKTTTISRAGFPPDGGGTWNIDAHGVLTADALVVTYPGDRTRGPHVIPFDRIIDVRFGDYGIKTPGLGSSAGDHGHHEHAANGH